MIINPNHDTTKRRSLMGPATEMDDTTLAMALYAMALVVSPRHRYHAVLTEAGHRLERHNGLRAELRALADLPDEQIDTSDIPEQRDWSGATRGKFTRED